MWHHDILSTIGKTPLIRLNRVTSHLRATVLAKVEYFNPGNSVKDRIALKMVEDAEKKGILKPGGTIIECTSGNTGMGLALVAAVKGYRCIFTITDKQSKEKIDILKAIGAEVIICPTNVPPEDPQSYYSVARRLSQEIPNSFFPFQYDNLSNTQAHYETTGPEIWEQTEGKVTHFVAGMGTCGTICGTSRYLKHQNPKIKTIGIDTEGSLLKKYIETGEIDMSEVGPYLLEGIGEDFIPANLDVSVIDYVIKVSDKDAALMARKLARLEGLFVGWSCGAAVHGALEYARSLSANDIVVVLLPDHGSRYLAKIYNDTWMQDHNFLEQESLSTAEDVIRSKNGKNRLLYVTKKDSLTHAISLMRENSISQLPVIENGQIVGSVNESRLLNMLIDDPSLKDCSVEQAMEDPFPFVLPTTRIDVISKMITSETPAVIVQNPDHTYDIITKSDLINILIH
ncbi:MAG: cystathionine beta-synthase [Bacteroidia bacterium]|nr:cystathionine beta-synthase [Bacteroidia bacterium]MDW8157712.1 cystathionine beta-synthase [Bacteroidia bacterium]